MSVVQIWLLILPPWTSVCPGFQELQVTQIDDKMMMGERKEKGRRRLPRRVKHGSVPRRPGGTKTTRVPIAMPQFVDSGRLLQLNPAASLEYMLIVKLPGHFTEARKGSAVTSKQRERKGDVERWT